MAVVIPPTAVPSIPSKAPMINWLASALVMYVTIYPKISRASMNSSTTKRIKFGLTFLRMVSIKLKNLITNLIHVCTCLPPDIH